MVLLKKINGSSLIETSIASAIILTVFMIGSLVLNNIFGAITKQDDNTFQNRKREIHYLLKHNKINLPFYEENNQWDFYAEKGEGEIILEATNKLNGEVKQIKIVINE